MVVDRTRKDLNQNIGLSSYNSNILKLFMEHIEQSSRGKLLDVGPVCEENIRFFAGRAGKLYVCDMFIRLGMCLHKGKPIPKIWQELNYGSEYFDGILLWELADRLDDQDVGMLVRCCYKMLKPGGMVMITVMGDQTPPSKVNAFVVGENFRIHLRRQPHLDLPLRSRQNRDVLSMMAPFVPAKSFICRPGFMEFLFKRE